MLIQDYNLVRISVDRIPAGGMRRTFRPDFGRAARNPIFRFPRPDFLNKVGSHEIASGNIEFGHFQGSKKGGYFSLSILSLSFLSSLLGSFFFLSPKPAWFRELFRFLMEFQAGFSSPFPFPFSELVFQVYLHLLFLLFFNVDRLLGVYRRRMRPCRSLSSLAYRAGTLH